MPKTKANCGVALIQFKPFIDYIIHQCKFGLDLEIFETQQIVNEYLV